MHVMFTITLTELSISLLGLVIKDGKVRHFVLLRGDIRHLSFFFFTVLTDLHTKYCYLTGKVGKRKSGELFNG